MTEEEEHDCMANLESTGEFSNGGRLVDGRDIVFETLECAVCGKEFSKRYGSMTLHEEPDGEIVKKYL